jgi:ribosomal protein L11 methyltransferase
VAARTGAAPQSFLDIGTGSGILAIAAAKLGHRPVEAFDFDADSVRVARENARRNQVSRQLRLSQADLTKLPSRSEKRFDLVCANLIYDLLLAERSRILNRVAPGGTLVLAGILTTQFELVQRAYEEKGWILIASQVENEWKSGAFQKGIPS